MKLHRTARKALVAAAFMAAGTAGGLMADGSFTLAESIIALGAGLVAGQATYETPNEPA